jgi:hypothetical protein
MRADALTIVCVISCESAGILRAVVELAIKKVSLDNVFTSVKRATPGGVDTRIVEDHRLGDYFEEIQIVEGSGDSPWSFRLVFHPRKDANRYWRDLLVNILQSIKDSSGGVAVRSVTKTS